MEELYIYIQLLLIGFNIQDINFNLFLPKNAIYQVIL